MLTSKQRATLSSMANSLDPLVHIGKAGLAEGVADALDKALADHELVKVRFVDFKDERRNLADELASRLGAELVRVIGHVAIMYRQSPEPEKRTIHV